MASLRPTVKVPDNQAKTPPPILTSIPRPHSNAIVFTVRLDLRIANRWSFVMKTPVLPSLGSNVRFPGLGAPLDQNPASSPEARDKVCFIFEIHETHL